MTQLTSCCASAATAITKPDSKSSYLFLNLSSNSSSKNFYTPNCDAINWFTQLKRPSFYLFNGWFLKSKLVDLFQWRPQLSYFCHKLFLSKLTCSGVCLLNSPLMLAQQYLANIFLCLTCHTKAALNHYAKVKWQRYESAASVYKQLRHLFNTQIFNFLYMGCLFLWVPCAINAHISSPHP